MPTMPDVPPDAAAYRYALAVLGTEEEARAVAHAALAVARTRADLLAVAHELCRRRAGAADAASELAHEGAPRQGPCGEAERALSRRLDGVLPPAGQEWLGAHLRTCPPCTRLAGDYTAQRAALRELLR